MLLASTAERQKRRQKPWNSLVGARWEGRGLSSAVLFGTQISSHGTE